MNGYLSARRILISLVSFATLCASADGDEIARYRVTYPYDGPLSFEPRDIRTAFIPIDSIDDPKPTENWSYGMSPRELLARIAPQQHPENYEGISTTSVHKGDYFIGSMALIRSQESENSVAWPDYVLFASDGKQLRSSSLSPELASATDRLDISSFDTNGKGQFLINDNVHSWLYDFGTDKVSPIMSMNSETDRQVTAYALNSSGSFVGNAWKSNADGENMRYAFVYDNGVMKDLNELVDPNGGVRIDFPVDLSDTGEIIALHIAQTPGQFPFQYMKLTPIVPEPASWLILAASCGFLWLIRRHAAARAAA